MATIDLKASGEPGAATARGAAITLERVTKRFGRRPVIDDLSIDVPPGVVAGFIGPNGAGKTTAMAMLLGLVRPTAGTGSVLGHSLDDPAAYLSRVGALIEAPAFWPALTGSENLRVLATLGDHDVGQIPEILDLVGLDGRGHDRFGEYSFGMKQRLGIAGALLGDPDLLVLDEPTNGLDPAGINDMRRLVARVGRGGRTVFVSSHILSELEQVCDWLVVIDHGSLVYQGRMQDFLDQASPAVVVAPEHPGDLERLEGLAEAEGFGPRRDGDVLSVPADSADPHALAAALNRAAMGGGIVLAELRVQRPSLEAHYLSLLEGGS